MADIKRLISHFTYRIEARPDGSFVAHATDPSIPPLEAPTRVELQQKIQQNITAALQTEFPGLKLPADQQQLKMSFHIERTPDGSFNIHSNDPNASPTGAAPHEIESKFAEKLIGMVGKHVLPQLSPELAAQVTSGDIKVFVSRTGFGKLPDVAGGQELQTEALESNEALEKMFGNQSTAGISYSGDNSPIHRGQPNSSWGLLRFLLTLLFLGAIAYFYLHYR